MRICPSCSTENSSDARFCKGCGTALAPTCTNCGSELPTDAAFCPSCGTPLSTAPAAETLKLATVLFADVVGSTARATDMHPEDVRDLMASYFDGMSKEIARHGGAVEKFIGDAIMAVFGVPTAHEDDPTRAVRAAGGMLESLEHWNEGRDSSEQLQVRIGINTGEVLAAGSVGQDLLVTGDAVNVAARLEQAAAPGTILVGERTARSIRGSFEVEPIGLIDAKGKQGISAWRVLHERAVIEERGIPGLRAPMIGRDEELDLLRSAVRRAQRDRRPHLVTIIGDAGVGKSRLVREFIDAVDAEIVAGRCLPYGDGLTLWPLAEILKQQAGVLDTDAPDVALKKIEELAKTSIPPDLTSDHQRAAAALASTIGLEPANGSHAPLEPSQVYAELLAAWRTLFTALSLERPLIAVIEDIHWADPTMLEVLEDLSDNVQGPVLFVSNARPDLLRSRPDWGGGRRNYTALPLDPLNEEQSALLISLLLDIEELPDRLKARILERAEGNPFFLEEIIRRLIDEGALVHREERWVAEGDLGDVEIPDNVQAVILARIDLLTPEERAVIQQAAVVGRLFWPGAVADRLPDVDVEAALRTLQRREFVLPRLSSSMAGENEFIFKHLLIRDVSYDSLPRKERGRSHLAVAAWIERVSGERSDEFAELLAHHFRSAYSLLHDDDLRVTARRYLLMASKRAVQRFAIQQAAALGRKAVELSTPGTNRADALEALGDVHMQTFNGDAGYETYIAGLDEVRDKDAAEGLRIARLAAKAAIIPTRWHGSVSKKVTTEEIHALIDEGTRHAALDSAERSILLAARAAIQIMGYEPVDEEGERAAWEAVAIADALDDPDLLSAAYDATSGLLMEQGRYREDLEVQMQRLKLLPRLSKTLEIYDALLMAAWACSHIGLYEDTIEYATQAIETARATEPGAYLHGLVWRVRPRFLLGDWDGALADQAEIERLVAQDPRDLPVGYARQPYGVAAFLHELRGNAAEGDAYLGLAKRFVDEDRFVGGESFPMAARAAIHRGDLRQAERFLVGERNYLHDIYLEARCELAGAKKDARFAARIVAEARAQTELGGLEALPLYADRLEALMAGWSADLPTANDLLTRSAEGFARLSSVWEEAYSRLLLAEIVAAHSPGEAKDHAHGALGTFVRLGSVAEIERAERVLADTPA
jgi:class 3 adenylate cyclase/tetratricopeptide (TPR) repeat protein